MGSLLDLATAEVGAPVTLRRPTNAPGREPSEGASAHVSPAPSGPVLRNVAMGQEPRLLTGPAREQRGRREGAPGHPGWGREEPSDPRGSAAQLEKEHHQRGLREGYQAAEAAQRAALEDALNGARQAGFEKGLQEGRREGGVEGRRAGKEEIERELRSAREAMSARLKRVDELLAGLASEVERRLASVEDEMVALCHAVVCRILGEQLLTPEGVSGCVRQALSEVSARSSLDATAKGRVLVHLNPRDLSTMERDEALGLWMRQCEALPVGVRWVADQQIDLGGCVIRSAEGSLDARLETQMAALRQVLLNGNSLSGRGDSVAAAEAPAVERSLPERKVRP